MKMRHERRAIDKIYKRRDRIDMPDYQREPVWTPDKKKLLIDTILKGWSIPKFYFEKIDEANYECVDGQQRLITIIEFFEDKVILAPDTVAEFGGDKYSTLPPTISDAFDDYEIDIEEIEDATDEELEELFKRLQLGTPLITAERLNAIRGKMRDFCQQITRNPFFKSKIKLKNNRFSHYEIAVRWLFLESRGIQPRVRLPQLEEFMSANKSFSLSSPTAKTVTATLAYLDKSFPGQVQGIRNKSNTLSVCMLASRVVRQELNKGTASSFGRFIEDFISRLSEEVEKGTKGTNKELREYQQAITSASAEAESIKTRLRILTKRLAEFSPEFSGLLGAYEDAADAASKSLSERAEAIRALVQRVNNKYMTALSEDMFKMTNKSAPALMNLARPRGDEKGFESLIDDLYFLFYEGSGSGKRLPDPKPEFVVTDVKFLRTLVRHDLDHGKPNEKATNRRKKAEVFRKYSGKDSIGECGPEELIAAQLRILEETQKFLQGLR